MLGDIALDDLSFVNGQCGTSPSKARPASLSTTVPPTMAATTPIVATSGKSTLHSTLHNTATFHTCNNIWYDVSYDHFTLTVVQISGTY